MTLHDPTWHYMTYITSNLPLAQCNLNSFIHYIITKWHIVSPSLGFQQWYSGSILLPGYMFSLFQSLATNNSLQPTWTNNWLHFSTCACHCCAGAMLTNLASIVRVLSNDPETHWGGNQRSAQPAMSRASPLPWVGQSRLMSCRCASLPLIAFFRPQQLLAVSQRSHSPARHENPEIPVIQLDYQFFSRDGEPVDEENRAPCPVGRLRCSIAAPPIATALICPLLPVSLGPFGMQGSGGTGNNKHPGQPA